MASFKEIKERISSVKNTRKITSAMKMVSAAKLHRAQAEIGGLLPYSEALSSIMKNLLTGSSVVSPFSEQREGKRVAVILFSSNSSLCGTFNSNVEKMLLSIDKELSADGGATEVEYYALGQKVAKAITKHGMPLSGEYNRLIDKPSYDPISTLASDLMKRFTSGEIDRVELVYHHFKSAASQKLVRETLLPVTLPLSEGEADYILEPSREEMIHSLIPKSIKLKLYAALLDSKASEHAVRMMAMQNATDNADELIGELTIQYNKSRQGAITAELLDLAGGAMN